jgi:WS/DGAT/MGAT family acyltransferase
VVFEGPPPAYEAFADHIRSRLHLVPRYRQKLAVPPLETGRPLWVDDTSFNLEFHVRHTALPKPGGRQQLRKLVERVYSQKLDRDKPLWEMWLAEGLEDDRFALITKTHHALIDGMAGVDILTLLFDLTPEPREVDPPERPWHARPKPSRAELMLDAAADVATRPLRLAREAVGKALHPRRTVGEALESARGVRDLLVLPALNPAPDVPLNTSIGPHRRVDWVSLELADFKAIKNELGGTVNDVVLAVVSGALRRWLEGRGTRTEGLELRAMVPVSVRTEDQRNQMGNQLAAMRGPLPVYAGDPETRLRIVTEAMSDLKDSRQALGAEVLANAQEFAPPTLLAQAARINFSTRLFNTIVTNVPGPQVPIYLLGRQMEEVVPLGFLAEGHTVFFAIMSYNGKLDISLLCDRDAMHDYEVLRDGLEESLEELKDAAGVTPKRNADRAARNGKPRKPTNTKRVKAAAK